MADSVHDYFYRGATPTFHQVIALHEEKEKSWEILSQKIPLLPRGWFELSRLPIEDRIEFSRDYWLSKLPFTMSRGSDLEDRIIAFFDSLQEIDLFATQLRADAPFEVHMVYSLKDDLGFFHGFPPAPSETLENFSSQFGNFNFPKDYLAFLEIHDGFSKFTDTGLIRTRDMSKEYLRFQDLLSLDGLLTLDEEIVDPKSLIPFYEAYGLHSYQCFFSDNRPTSEVRNLYYAELEGSSEEEAFFEERRLDESLTFSSFLAWLCFYLEDVGYATYDK